MVVLIMMVVCARVYVLALRSRSERLVVRGYAKGWLV
jgi:hypothetical protein